jgi:hypothetical protein
MIPGLNQEKSFGSWGVQIVKIIIIIIITFVVVVGRDSSVGIATCYGVGGPVIESLCRRVFRTRPDRPWGLPNLLYNGYRVLTGVMRPGHGADHPLSSSAEVKERVKPYLYFFSGPSWPVLEQILLLIHYYYYYYYILKLQSTSVHARYSVTDCKVWNLVYFSGSNSLIVTLLLSVSTSIVIVIWAVLLQVSHSVVWFVIASSARVNIILCNIMSEHSQDCG